MKVTVTEKTVLTANVSAFKLVSVTDEQLPPWEPGSHIEISLPNGLIKHYSLCGAPTQNNYEIAVLREPFGKGGSLFLHDQVNVGDTLEISPPVNHFKMNPSDRKRLFIAAGIGVTPLLAMADQSRGCMYDFVMCAKNEQSVPYIDRLNSLPSIALHFSESAGSRLDIAAFLAEYDVNTAVYVCGPQAFIDEVVSQCLAQGWPATNVHKEYFGLSKSDNEEGNSLAFHAKIKSTGQLIPVRVDQNLAEALEEHDIFVPIACGEGVCGTCVTGVVAGEPDHRDVFLTEDEKAEGQLIALCCSRALSAEITLDL